LGGVEREETKKFREAMEKLGTGGGRVGMVRGGGKEEGVWRWKGGGLRLGVG